MRKTTYNRIKFKFLVDYSTVLCYNTFSFDRGGEKMKLEQKINLVIAIINLVTALIALYKALD